VLIQAAANEWKVPAAECGAENSVITHKAADRCEVWGPTQNGEAALAAVSEESGLPIAKCDVHKYLCGGGFGRRFPGGLCAPDGRDHQANARHADQADLVARRGHDPLRLPPRHAVRQG
jgi:hypothetical protein